VNPSERLHNRKRSKQVREKQTTEEKHSKREDNGRRFEISKDLFVVSYEEVNKLELNL